MSDTDPGAVLLRAFVQQLIAPAVAEAVAGQAAATDEAMQRLTQGMGQPSASTEHLAGASPPRRRSSMRRAPGWSSTERWIIFRVVRSRPVWMWRGACPRPVGMPCTT
jgi:hypothetical protein